LAGLRRLALGCAVWRWVAPFGAGLRRLALMALCCLSLAGVAKASGSLGVDLTDGGCYDVSDLNTSTSTQSVTAHLIGDYVPYLQSINSFVIVVNGISYTATTSVQDNTIKGTVTVPLTRNPMRLVCYARATVTYSGRMPTFSESYDSRDATNDPDLTTGQGKTFENIYSKIRLRGLRFDGAACNAYNHSDGLTYPISKGGQKYHWFRDNPVSSTVSGPYPAVYLKSSAPQLNISTEPLASGVPVRAKVSVTNGAMVYASSSSVPGYPYTTTPTLSNSSTTLSLPSLLDSVNIYTVGVTLSYQCQLSDGTWAMIYPFAEETVSLRIYAVNAQPTAPMAIPWTGVLEDSCRFAAGKNTADNVAKEETRGVYFSKRIAYPLSTASNWIDAIVPTTFRLTDFLNTGGYQAGNCVDVSDYLCICANAQGLSFTVSQHGNVDGQNVQTQLISNPVCLVGGDPNALSRPDGSAQWSVSSWAWHQLCLRSNAVYDSCAAHKFDLSGNFYGNPPINWPLGGYWQTNLTGGPVTSSGGTWNHLGLVDYSYMPPPGDPSPNPSTPIPFAAFGSSYQSTYTPTVR
jgi:hypothetical protein